jgi:cytochrome c oxidase subunit 4
MAADTQRGAAAGVEHMTEHTQAITVDEDAGRPAHEPGHPLVGHLVGWPILLGTLIVLLALTWITVAATWVNLGRLNLWIALIVATIKGALVCMYFMHLRYDRPFNAILLFASLLFVLLFIGLSLSDTVHYRSELIWDQVELNPRGS